MIEVREVLRVGQVVEAVRPVRPKGHGAAWEVLLGQEEQIRAWVAGDGHLGYLLDQDGRRRKVHALILTAVYSRHMFVWLTYSQTLTAVIAGGEAAWSFFAGVCHANHSDGREVLDLSASWTATDLGHGHAAVVQAVIEAMT